MAAKTFLELQNDALRQVDELSGSGSATARVIIKNGLNEAYSLIAGIRDWKTLENNTTVTTASGTQEYTPITSSSATPRIRRIQSVIDETNNILLEEVRREVFERSYPYVASTDTGKPKLWFESGYTNSSSRDIKIKLYQVPDGTYTLRVNYYEEPLEMQSDDTIPRIPDQYHFGLELHAIAKYYEYQRDPSAAYFKGEFERFKKDILAAEYGDTDEMPSIIPQDRKSSGITGKIGRIYN